MFYLVPPTGTPVTSTDIGNLFKSWISSKFGTEIISDKIKEYTGAKHCFFFNSGRTALYFILKSLNQIESTRNEIIIPAYTCFSVAAAIVRSGLKIRPVDIDPLTLDYDYEKLAKQDFENVLAIMGCNLFGILNDWDMLKSVAASEKTYLIDDAAQSLGSSYKGNISGTLGDVGFYSLGRGKNLSAMSGGILITDNDRIAGRVSENINELGDVGVISNLKRLLEIVLYSIFLRPRLYWLPDKLPFLGLGLTIFDENFGMSELAGIQLSATSILFSGLDEINAIRSRNAQTISEKLYENDSYVLPGYSSEKPTIFLRLPVLAQNRSKRDKIISDLQRAGIKSSSMYPSTVREIAGIEKYLTNPEDIFGGAQEVVDRLFTLPTHHYVKEKEIRKMLDCLAGE